MLVFKLGLRRLTLRLQKLMPSLSWWLDLVSVLRVRFINKTHGHCADLALLLGHLVDIVGRVFESLDLNPLLIDTIGNVTSAVGDIVGDVAGAVSGLLGSITQGDKTLNFIVDNLGNIVQEVGGVSTIVGDFTRNMTETGVTKDLGKGLTQKEFSYSPLNSLIDIVFDSAGRVVSSVVQKKNGGGSNGGSSGGSSGSGSGSNSTVSATSSSSTSS